MYDEPIEPGTEVLLLSGARAWVVQDQGRPDWVVCQLADGEMVRTTHAALEVAAMRAGQMR